MTAVMNLLSRACWALVWVWDLILDGVDILTLGPWQRARRNAARGDLVVSLREAGLNESADLLARSRLR